MIFNEANGGYLGQRLKNDRQAITMRNVQNCDQAQAEESTQQPLQTELAGSECGLDEAIQLLKGLTLKEENMETIKKLLKQTFEHRKQMSKDLTVQFAKKFPYVFIDPRLVKKSFLCLCLQ